MAKTRRRVISGRDIQAIVERNAIGVREILLCSPFVTKEGIAPLLQAMREHKTRVNLHLISRFDEVDWLTGATDPQVFADLLELAQRPNNKKWRVKITLVDGLHAKAVVLGDKLAILGSANLTGSGLGRNHELGVVLRGAQVETIRERLRGYIEAGVPLTQEVLEAKRERLKRPEYEAFKHMLQKTRRLSGRWRGRALKEFPSGNGHIEYASRVVDLLQFMARGSDTSFEQLVAWLDQHSTKSEPDADKDRIYMLEALGLVDDLGSRWQLAGRGKAVVDAQDPQLALYQRLRSRWPCFLTLEEHLAKPRTNGRVFHAKELVRFKAFRKDPAEDGEHATVSAQQFWELRLRWLQSVGILEGVAGQGKQRKRYRVVPERLSAARGDR